MKSEAKCPFNHALVGDATTNRDWWPKQLRVDLLNQHSTRSHPLDETFDYAEAFKGLDYDRQVTILKPRVNMAQLATPAGVAKFIDKFLAMDQVRQVNEKNAKSSPMLSLFGGNEGGTAGPRGLDITA